MFGCKVLMTNTLKKYKKILERRRHNFHFLHLLSCSLFLLSNILIKVNKIYFLIVQTDRVVSMADLYGCHTWKNSKQNLWLTKLSFVSSINDITHHGQVSAAFAPYRVRPFEFAPSSSPLRVRPFVFAPTLYRVRPHIFINKAKPGTSLTT